jgi:hypothetical protein
MKIEHKILIINFFVFFNRNCLSNFAYSVKVALTLFFNKKKRVKMDSNQINSFLYIKKRLFAIRTATATTIIKGNADSSTKIKGR